MGCIANHVRMINIPEHIYLCHPTSVQAVTAVLVGLWLPHIELLLSTIGEGQHPLMKVKNTFFQHATIAKKNHSQ